MKKLLISLLLFCSAQTSLAGQTLLQGTHNDEDYEIALNDEWEDVIGSWGEHKKYNLAWDSYDLTLKGKTAGISQDFYYDSVFKEVRFESDCGFTELHLDLASRKVSGWYCEKQWEQTFASKKEMVDVISEMVLKELVMFFPEPTQAPIHKFFKPKLVHGLSLENANSATSH